MSIGGRRDISLEPLQAAMACRVDALVARLLAEIQIPFTSIAGTVLHYLADLKAVLAADYCKASGLPDRPLLRELARLVDKDLRSHAMVVRDWHSPEVTSHLSRIFGPREIDLRAEPYLRGAGLGLRGFFCRADFGHEKKFVIFINTAHHPAAVAATMGHELGHYIYDAICGEGPVARSFMEGTFANHLGEVRELFADSLVALAAYSHDLIRRIGPVDAAVPLKPRAFVDRIQKAHELIGSRFEIDLARKHLKAPWRLRYLTSMIHFLKLRHALLQCAGL